MMSNVGFDTYEPWSGEQRPLYLAPMAGVSDLPYRLLAKDCGADITITEFTNSTALSREATASWRKMESDPREQPFIPQIFGGEMEMKERSPTPNELCTNEPKPKKNKFIGSSFKLFVCAKQSKKYKKMTKIEKMAKMLVFFVQKNGEKNER